MFGCGAFDALPYCSDVPTDQIAFYQDKKNLSREFYGERMEKWISAFNYGTLPFYWAGYEPTEGDVQFESALPYCAKDAMAMF